ncbi:ribonuclease H-like domain-containing protein, partial [Tanacetum coccineum]
MAPLPPRQQRYLFLRNGLFARMVMEHRDDASVVVEPGDDEIETFILGLGSYKTGRTMKSLGFARSGVETLPSDDGTQYCWEESGIEARLTEHFGLLTAEILGGLTVISLKLSIIDIGELVDDTWAWVAMGPERQPDAAAGDPTVAKDAHAADEGDQAVWHPCSAPQSHHQPPSSCWEIIHMADGIYGHSCWMRVVADIPRIRWDFSRELTCIIPEMQQEEDWRGQYLRNTAGPTVTRPMIPPLFVSINMALLPREQRYQFLCTAGIKVNAVEELFSHKEEIDLETAQTNTTAKLPLLKQGEYDMWKLRIEKYFQVQDYALWDIIENENSFKPAAQTGSSTTLVPGPVTTEEKAQKKNDVKARSMLLMTLPNEHLMAFNQYKDAKTLFAAIQTRFGGENILQEDLNLKFLRSLPSEWNTHVVVWRNKSDLYTMSFDDLYNNFKIIKQEVKGTASSSSSLSSQNMAFVSSPSSTNEVNTAYGVSTANTQVSPASTQVSTASTQVSTANLSDDTVYAFLASQPNGSQLVYEDLEQIHEDDIEEMDLKWQLALLSMRTRRFFQKTGRKITINGSDTAGYDKSKVECFNCHKMGHFARECRGPRNQDSRNRNQDSSRRTVNVEETSSKAMVAIDGAGFDWSYMADDEVPTNMALMAFSDSEVHNDKTCSKTCLKSFETLKTQLDDLRIEFNKSEFNLATYKRGLASVEEQLVFYKKNEVIFCEQLVVLKRDISYKDSEISMLKRSQITDKSRKGMGFVSYNVVPPPHTGLFSPLNLDLSYSGLEEFQQPKFEGYGPKSSKSISKDISNEVRESPDASLVEELVPNDKLEKKTIFPTVAKIEFGHPQKEDHGYVDSGCSRHMTGNMSYLSDFKEFNGRYVTFGEGAKGGKITGKGTPKIGKLDFEDVYFVKEL